MRVKTVTIIPIEVVVRNIAAGSLCRQTGITEGTVLNNPLITRDRLFLLDIVTQEQLFTIKKMAFKINHHLQEFFKRCQIILVDFKLEFGFDFQQQIILADEISN